MSFFTAAAVIGGSVIGAIASNKASKRAAKGQQKAIDAQNRLLGPYSEAGHAALPALQSFVDEGARFSDTAAYKDIVNSAKAGGMNLSGNRLTALTDYYATNFRPQRMNELSFIPTLGANAAAGQATNTGNMYNAQGQSRAAGIMGIGNSLNTGLNSLAFLNMYNKGQQTNPGGFNGGWGAPVNYGRGLPSNSMYQGGNQLNPDYIPPTNSYWSGP